MPSWSLVNVTSRPSKCFLGLKAVVLVVDCSDARSRAKMPVEHSVRHACASWSDKSEFACANTDSTFRSSGSVRGLRFFFVCMHCRAMPFNVAATSGVCLPSSFGGVLEVVFLGCHAMADALLLQVPAALP